MRPGDDLGLVDGPDWSEVRDDWLPNDGLRDIYVCGSTADDWQRILDIVRAREWPETFSVNGDVVPMPASVQPIFELVDETILWQFWPHSDVAVHGHFHAAEEIELNLDPRESAELQRCKTRGEW